MFVLRTFFMKTLISTIYDVMLYMLHVHAGVLCNICTRPTFSR